MALRFTTQLPTELVSPARIRRHPAHGGNVGYPRMGQQWADIWGPPTEDLIVTAPQRDRRLYLGRPNIPKAIVVHTPEETPDDRESTPVWFADIRSRNATHLYGDDDGDYYQMVPFEIPAWAQGVGDATMAHNAGAILWYDGYSFNTSAISIELEGFARELPARWARLALAGEPNPQRESFVKVIAHLAGIYQFPIDREHLIGHYQISNQRTDPGEGFPWDAVIDEAHAVAAGLDRGWPVVDRAAIVGASGRIDTSIEMIRDSLALTESALAEIRAAVDAS